MLKSTNLKNKKELDIKIFVKPWSSNNLFTTWSPFLSSSTNKEEFKKINANTYVLILKITGCDASSLSNLQVYLNEHSDRKIDSDNALPEVCYPAVPSHSKYKNGLIVFTPFNINIKNSKKYPFGDIQYSIKIVHKDFSEQVFDSSKFRITKGKSLQETTHWENNSVSLLEYLHDDGYSSKWPDIINLNSKHQIKILQKSSNMDIQNIVVKLYEIKESKNHKTIIDEIKYINAKISNAFSFGSYNQEYILNINTPIQMDNSIICYLKSLKNKKIVASIIRKNVLTKEDILFTSPKFIFNPNNLNYHNFSHLDEPEVKINEITYNSNKKRKLKEVKKTYNSKNTDKNVKKRKQNNSNSKKLKKNLISSDSIILPKDGKNFNIKEIAKERQRLNKLRNNLKNN